MNEFETTRTYYILLHGNDPAVGETKSPTLHLQRIIHKESENQSHSFQNQIGEERKTLEGLDYEESNDAANLKEYIISSSGSVFSADGPAPFQGDILENPALVWTEDVWTEEKEKKALDTLSKQGEAIGPYWRQHYIERAGSYWHDFYRRNQDHFYKDRHYLHIVFPELQVHDASGVSLLEVGCGVGNAVLPLLEINPTLSITAIDFAKSAIQILTNTIETRLPLEKQSRITAAVNNITQDELPIPSSSVNYVLCLFVLSAISPEYHRLVFQKLYNTLKIGGKLFFRDYGRYDEAQLRFKKGCKLDHHFYVRQDGTCSYFFTIEELTTIANEIGFKIEEIYYIYRQYANRQQKKARYRVWIHAKLIK